MPFTRPYKPRGRYKRYYFVNSNSFPERCSKKDYDFWKKEEGFTVKTHSREAAELSGKFESVYNAFGSLVGYVSKY